MAASAAIERRRFKISVIRLDGTPTCPIDNAPRRNHVPNALRGDGRFAKRSRKRQQGRRRGKRRRRGGAPGGAPPPHLPPPRERCGGGMPRPKRRRRRRRLRGAESTPAPPGAPLPSLYGSKLLATVRPRQQSSGAQAPRERDLFSSPAAAGVGGPRGARWRGCRPRRFVAVAKNFHAGKKERASMIEHLLAARAPSTTRPALRALAGGPPPPLSRGRKGCP